MFDVKKVEQEAAAELAEEASKEAKSKIKASLRTVTLAEAALANARREHEVLLRTIGA